MSGTGKEMHGATGGLDRLSTRCERMTRYVASAPPRCEAAQARHARARTDGARFGRRRDVSSASRDRSRARDHARHGRHTSGGMTQLETWVGVLLQATPRLTWTGRPPRSPLI